MREENNMETKYNVTVILKTSRNKSFKNVDTKIYYCITAETKTTIDFEKNDRWQIKLLRHTKQLK